MLINFIIIKYLKCHLYLEKCKMISITKIEKEISFSWYLNMMRRINLIRALNKRVKESWMSKYINSIFNCYLFLECLSRLNKIGLKMRTACKMNWIKLMKSLQIIRIFSSSISIDWEIKWQRKVNLMYMKTISGIDFKKFKSRILKSSIRTL